MSPRVVTVKEAVAVIADGATVVTDGFTMMGVAEAVFAGIEDSFLQTDHPRDLVVVHASGQSNRQQRVRALCEQGSGPASSRISLGSSCRACRRSSGKTKQRPSACLRDKSRRFCGQ